MKRVLLVDDNSDSRKAIRMVLESQGLDCSEVLNGADALTWLEDSQVDLIVTDNQMPTLTGLEFIQHLMEKADPHTPPIILLSGNLDESDKALARNAGAYAILDKPCNFSEFLSVVTLALESQAQVQPR